MEAQGFGSALAILGWLSRGKSSHLGIDGSTGGVAVWAPSDIFYSL